MKYYAFIEYHINTDLAVIIRSKSIHSTLISLDTLDLLNEALDKFEYEIVSVRVFKGTELEVEREVLYKEVKQVVTDGVKVRVKE